MPRAIPSIVHAISKLKFGNPPFQFEADAEPLAPLLAQLNAPLPADLKQYLDHCIPVGDGEFGIVEFHTLETLLEEQTEADPGCDVFPHGFFCFAKEGDGSQFAFCIHDERIYQLHAGDGENGTIQTIQQCAETTWPTLRDFLLNVEQRLSAEQ